MSWPNQNPFNLAGVPGFNPVMRPPPLFPSAFDSNINPPNPNFNPSNAPNPIRITNQTENGSKKEVEDENNVVAEQLFPPGKTADLQIRLNSDFTNYYIGLEFMIEIQHNTTKKMANSYCCLLCDTDIYMKNKKVDTIELAKNHLTTNIHKLKYLTKYFPTIQKVHLNSKTIDHSVVNSLVEKILQHAAIPMKIKIVVGQKLFKRKQAEIKKIIENSTHHIENEVLIEQLCGSKGKTARIDAFNDVFEELEKESRLLHRSGKSPPRREKATSLKSIRRIDKVNYDGLINPMIDPPKEPESGTRKTVPKVPHSDPSGVSPPRGSQNYVPVIIDEDNDVEHIPGLSPPKSSRNSKGRESEEVRKSKERSKSRSRSESAANSRKRRHSEASSISSVSSIGGESEKQEPLSEKDREAEQKANAELDALVEEFLNEEKRLFDKLDADRRHYLAKPDSHREYTAEWNYFYKKRCDEEGMKIHISMVKDEWDDHWHRFLSREFKLYEKEESSRLFRRYGIKERDIKGYHLRRKKREQEKKNQPPTESEVTVLHTMTLLFAVEQHLEYLSLKVSHFLSKAKYIESQSGSAKLLLENQEFIDFLHESKELVMKKSGQIPEKTVKAISESIGILLQKTSVKPTASTVLNITKFQDPLKVGIAQTIVNHFKDIGRPLAQDVLDGLVNTEFERVQAMRMQQQQQFLPPHPPQHYEMSQSQHYQSHQESHQSQSYSEPVDQPMAQASGPNINWEMLNMAVKNASTGGTQPQTSTLSTSTPATTIASNQDTPNVEDEAEDYDDLTVEELASLLQNFKSLEASVQKQLMTYMKKLEKVNPKKVKELQAMMHSKK